MTSFQILYQPRAVIHLLTVCLLLETAYGEDNWINLLSIDINVSLIDEANKLEVKLTIQNNVKKCMVVKVSIEDNPNITYLSAHATYTACICSLNNYFWDIQISANTVLIGKAEVVTTENICPDDEDIFPVTSYTTTVSHEILVTT
ncbi:prolactin-inducible protein homolog [Psammomys obesus]|uniref:prolactin-inducible protein homolog n=1 Tax=Psammomys obesus TaxID=48139 RepID=UPI0024535865|nr:prolactin-inducible protein homolog [Psammomys obesus]